MKKYGKFYGMIAFAFLFQACGETGIPDPDPKPSPGLDFIININESPYTALKNVAGSAIDTKNKVIIARLSSSTWAAVSSTCPNNSGTSVRFDGGPYYFICTDPITSVITSFDLQGKALDQNSKNLTSYKTTFSVNSGELRIYEN